mgnify:CR=1 FL=1
MQDLKFKSICFFVSFGFEKFSVVDHDDDLPPIDNYDDDDDSRALTLFVEILLNDKKKRNCHS